jgi:integrase
MGMGRPRYNGGSSELKLKKEDVLGTHIVMREMKTRKQKRTRIPPSIRNELIAYAKELKDGEFLIKRSQRQNKPIDRSVAYRILREAAEHVKVKEVGTHTLRKTFGYHFYKQSKDVAMLQRLFNHSSPSITLQYIGITQDSMDEAMMKFKL